MAKSIKELKLEEAQELLSFIGIEDAEKFKDEFNSKFFTKETAVANEDIARAITGKRMKTVESSFLELAKLVDPTVTKAKLGEKPIEENIAEFVPLFSGRFGELETRAKEGNDKRVNDLEKQLQDREKSLTAYKELADKTASEFEGYKAETANSIKSYKIKHQYEALKSQLPWVDDVTDVQRIGFDTFVQSNYQLDLDEKDNLIVKDKDGKPVQSKQKAAMADPMEILDTILDANKLKKNNNVKQNNRIFTQREEPKSGRQLSKDYLSRLPK